MHFGHTLESQPGFVGCSPASKRSKRVSVEPGTYQRVCSNRHAVRGGGWLRYILDAGAHPYLLGRRDAKKEPPARSRTEEEIEAMYQRMQEPGFGDAVLEAFWTPPRVRVEFPAAATSLDQMDQEDLLSKE